MIHHIYQTKNWKQLLYTWIRLIFFESISPTKPILLFIGPKGSLKSSFLKHLGQILFGENFNVSPVSNTEKDFDATIVNNYLVCVDNADSYKSWIEDKLACVATGQKYQYRPLFKDITELLQLEPHCFIGVTCRTPTFTRDDVADRSLIIRVGRLEKEGFKSEASLKKYIIKNRDKMISHLIMDLQETLKELEKPWNEAERYHFRMADFAAFATRINGKKTMSSILKKLNKEQAALVAEHDLLVCC